MKNYINNSVFSIVDLITKENFIKKNSVIKILEDAIAIVAKTIYSKTNFIKSSLNKTSSFISIYREFIIINRKLLFDSNLYKLSNKTKIELHKIRNKKILFNHGDIIRQILPSLTINRLNFIFIKHFIINKIINLERNKIVDEYKNKVGEILTGIVEKVEISGYIVKFSNIESMLKKNQVLKTDFYRLGQQIKVYLQKIERTKEGLSLILSRKHKNFVKELFRHKVLEIHNKIVYIKSIARDPGFKTKIAVHSIDNSIDPVFKCTGLKGIKVKSIIRELRGEKIDIVKWNEDLATFLINSLGAFIRVKKIVFDELQNKVELVLPHKYKSKVIGVKGRNIRLLSDLVKWKINIVSEEIDIKRRKEEFIYLVKFFIKALNVEKILAQLLVANGFKNIYSIKNFSEVYKVEGIDVKTAKELNFRANEYLQKI